MAQEQRKDALEALDRLENDAVCYALCYRDGYGETRKDAETIRAALQSQKVPVIKGLDEAIVVLSEHNKWRRGEHPYDGDHPQPMEITPKQLGLAIECVLKASSAYAKLQKEVNK